MSVSETSLTPAPIRTVAVFGASADGVDPLLRAAAEELGRALASRHIGIVYGAARIGLMGVVADAALAHGGYVVGVIPKVLVDMEVAHDGLNELHITSTMHTRKALMGERSDAFLILPGGYGTLEELFEVLAWQTLRLHEKRIVLLNTAGFYDRMLGFLDHCVEQGVLKAKAREVLEVVSTVDEMMQTLSL